MTIYDRADEFSSSSAAASPISATAVIVREHIS